jgi:hypothetical protein
MALAASNWTPKPKNFLVAGTTCFPPPFSSLTADYRPTITSLAEAYPKQLQFPGNYQNQKPMNQWTPWYKIHRRPLAAAWARGMAICEANS